MALDADSAIQRVGLGFLEALNWNINKQSPGLRGRERGSPGTGSNHKKPSVVFLPESKLLF